MDEKQRELIDIVIKDLDYRLNYHLECLLDYTLRSRSGDLIEYEEKRVMAITLVKTILKSYKKEIDHKER